jgi:hypothetical protein
MPTMVSELLSGFTPTDKVFAAFAFIGTLFFFLRVVWMLVGGLGDSDLQDVAHHADGAHVTHEHGSDSVFRLFSINSVTGFFMMFGWMGLMASRQFTWGIPVSLLTALTAGVASMFLIAWVFYLFVGMQSSGERFDLAAAVGQTASVYLRIPENGKGRVQVTLSGVQREFEAVSENHQAIESFKNVKIVRLVDHQTVAVLPL